MNETILGLDIGGTSTAAVLGNRRGQVVERVEFTTQAERGFEQTFSELCASVERLQAQHAGPPPEALSVSIGGPLEIERGIVHSPPNLPGWDDVPLKALLTERFGLPVYVEHDGNAGALAEWYFGAARSFARVYGRGLGLQREW